jgi:hypothetical protein
VGGASGDVGAWGRICYAPLNATLCDCILHECSTNTLKHCMSTTCTARYMYCCYKRSNELPAPLDLHTRLDKAKRGIQAADPTLV